MASTLIARLRSPRTLALLLWTLLAAIALLNIGRALRADDIWSLRAASLPFPEMIRTIQADVHPPLYFVLLNAWIGLFGTTETALRSLSLLLHIGAAASLFFAVRPLSGPGPAHLAAAVYAVSPLAVLSAELVRMYSLLGLLSVLTIAAWRRAAASPAKPVHWAALAASVALGTFTHVWFLFLLTGLGVASLIHFRPRSPKLIAAMGAGCLPFAVLWFPSLIAQAGRSSEAAAWLKPPDLAGVGLTLLLQAGPALLFLPLAALAARRGLGAEFPVPAWTWTIWLAAMAPPLAVSFFKPVFYSRFTIVAVPLVAIAAAGLLSRLRPLPTAASLALLSLLVYAGAAGTRSQCDGRCAAEALANSAKDGDAVIYGSLSRPATSHYLAWGSARRAFSETSFPSEIDSHPGYEGAYLASTDLSAQRAEAAALVRRLEAAGTRRVYFLAGYRKQVDQLIEDALARSFKPAAPLIECGNGDYFTTVLVFERSSPAAPLQVR